MCVKAQKSNGVILQCKDVCLFRRMCACLCRKEQTGAFYSENIFKKAEHSFFFWKELFPNR